MDLSDFVQVRQKRVHRGGVRQWLAPKIVPWLKAPLKVGPQARLALGVVLGDLVGGHAGNGQQQRRNHSRPVLTGVAVNDHSSWWRTGHGMQDRHDRIGINDD
jgi:hypothetical protein